MRYFVSAVLVVSLAVLGCEGGGNDKSASESEFQQSADALVHGWVTNGPSETSSGPSGNMEKELATLPEHEWAGEYYHGDGLGVNVSLSLAPQSGFVFTWHGCLGLYDRNYGNVATENGFVRLNPRLPNHRKGFQGIATEFLPVRWGERRYLIASDEIVDFCNAVNQGDELRHHPHGFFLLRNGDWQKTVEGWPDVPAKYRKFLQTKPIVAEILAVGTSNISRGTADIIFKATTVTLNAGQKHGVLPGMGFQLVDPHGVVSTLIASTEVTIVAHDTCEAKITQIGDESAPPQIGWKFSTRSPRLNDD